MRRLFLLASAVSFLAAQEWPRPSKDAVMTIEEYDPKSSLKVPEHPKTRAKFPIIDFHNHQRGEMPAAQMDKLVADMDKINLQIMVNLSGGYGDRLTRNVKAMKAKYPDRFVVFANLSFEEIDAPDYADRAARQLEEDFKNGAQGLKFFKNFGMDLSDKSGVRVKIDDPRFDKAFEVCAKYKRPVMSHTAEPKPFFMPWDKHNERCGAQAVPQPLPPRRQVPRLGSPDGRALPPHPAPPQCHLRQRPPGLARRRPRPARQAHGPDAEHDD